jgi:GLPGLI family protein
MLPSTPLKTSCIFAVVKYYYGIHNRQQMNRTIFIWIAVLTATITTSGTVSGQRTWEGSITYKQVIRYSFTKIKEAHGDDQQTSGWLASLPEESSAKQLLSFNPEKALFEEGDSESVAADPRLQRAIMYEGMLSPPRPVVQKVYYDFGKNQKVKQVEFLTRIFLVNSEIQALPWKLGSEKMKVLEYTCVRATMTLDDQEIVAWFTPEIPVSLGPSIFSGLPGLILAVERNGETAYVATSVDLTPPSEGALIKPDQGSKVSVDEFAAIREKKEKEWKENSSSDDLNPHR